MHAFRVAALLTLALLSVVACGASPTATQVAQVEMVGCVVGPHAVNPGQITFTVHNGGAVAGSFVIKEDDDTKEVGSVAAPVGSTQKLVVDLDHGDEYVLHCGDVKSDVVYKP